MSDNEAALELVPLQEILNKLDELGMRGAVRVIQSVVCVDSHVHRLTQDRDHGKPLDYRPNNHRSNA